MHSLVILSILLFILSVIPTFAIKNKHLHIGLYLIKSALIGWITGGLIALHYQGLL